MIRPVFPHRPQGTFYIAKNGRIRVRRRPRIIRAFAHLFAEKRSTRRYQFETIERATLFDVNEDDAIFWARYVVENEQGDQAETAMKRLLCAQL